MTYTYSYLIMDLLFLVGWVFFFVKCKEIRKEILIISVGLGLMGLFLETIYIGDWWMPLTITGRIPAIESFLYAFAKGGFAMGLFYMFFKGNEGEIDVRKYVIIIGLVIILFMIMHYFFEINTFITTITILILGLARIYYKRPEVIKASILSGLLFLIIAVIIYNIVELITPGWIEAFWYFRNVPEIILLNMPVDDLIYYPLFGAAIGSIYEYVKKK